MFADIAEMRREAAAKGIATVIWSYPRGEDLDKDGETAADVTAYAAHIAALLGAHIIKVKLSTDHLSQPEAKKAFEAGNIPVKTQADRVRECVRSSFDGRRIIVFSGGAAKGTDSVLDDARAIRDGGGNGSIIGRNCFQRPRDEALGAVADAGRYLQGPRLMRAVLLVLVLLAGCQAGGTGEHVIEINPADHLPEGYPPRIGGVAGLLNGQGWPGTPMTIPLGPLIPRCRSRISTGKPGSPCGVCRWASPMPG